MMSVQELYLSKEGLDNLQKELANLKVQRVEITQKIKEAREYGDLSENAEYQEAKIKQAFVEGRIEEIEATLKLAKVIDTKNNTKGEVCIGSTVVVDVKGNEVTYQLTGSDEANPAAGKISHESPLGRALIGKRVGEKVTVSTPDGEREYLVVRVG